MRLVSAIGGSSVPALLVAGAVTAGGFAMAQKQTDVELQEYLDRRYPFIGQNDEPPGRWKPYDNGQPGQHWSGQHGWRTQHGPSVVRWDLARPVHVSGAELPDGTRIDVQNSMGAWRYRLSDHPRRWVHGTVDIRPDGVTFRPGEQPGYTAPDPTDRPDLYSDMAGDSALRERLLDEDFADALYAYLKNAEFFKEGGERIQSFGLSGTAGMVANLRGEGDVYTDYYPHGGRAPLSENPYAAHRAMDAEEAALEAALTARFTEIKAILLRLGWRRATLIDRNVAAAATRRDLASWEARPEGVAPDWVARIAPSRAAPAGAIRLMSKPRHQMTEAERVRDEEIANGTLQKRLHSLAASGRISEIEYREMIGRIADIP